MDKKQIKLFILFIIECAFLFSGDAYAFITFHVTTPHSQIHIRPGESAILVNSYECSGPKGYEGCDHFESKLDFEVALPTRITLAVRDQKEPSQYTYRIIERPINDCEDEIFGGSGSCGELIKEREQLVNNSTHYISIDLNPGKFTIEFTGEHPSRVSPDTDTLTAIVQEATINIDTIQLLKGLELEILLDQITNSAYRQFTLQSKSLVRLIVDKHGRNNHSFPRVNLSAQNENNSAPLVSRQENGGGKLTLSYVLNPGTYYLIVKPKSLADLGPRPKPKADHESNGVATYKFDVVQYKVGLTVDDVVEQKLPSSMKTFVSWLESSEFRDKLTFVEFADLRNPDRSLPGSVDRLGPYALSVASRKTKPELDIGFMAYDVWHFWGEEKLSEYVHDNQINWPKSITEEKRPKLVVFFITDGFELVENWNKILQKLSLSENVSQKDIIVISPLWCRPGIIFMDSDYVVRRHGGGCSSALISQVAYKLDNAGFMETPSLNRLTRKNPKISKAVLNVLNESLPIGAQVEQITMEDDFVEVIIRGIQGEIVQKGKNWEKLQVTAFIQRDMNKKIATLRLSIDGQLASGIGEYPKDSEFTRDMEPEFSGQLFSYTKKLSNKVVQELNKRKI